MKNILLILATLIVFASCKPTKIIVEKYHTRDSIRTEKTEIKYRDTNIVVNLPKQNTTVIDTNIIIQNNTPYTSKVISAETDYAKAYSQVIQGRLQLSIENKDSAKIYIKNAVKEVLTEIIEKQNESIKETETKIETKNELNWFQKIFFWIGLISFLIVTLFIILRQLFKNRPLWL